MPRFDRWRSVMAPRHTVVVRGPPSFADRSRCAAVVRWHGHPGRPYQSRGPGGRLIQYIRVFFSSRRRASVESAGATGSTRYRPAHAPHVLDGTRPDSRTRERRAPGGRRRAPIAHVRSAPELTGRAPQPGCLRRRSTHGKCSIQSRESVSASIARPLVSCIWHHRQRVPSQALCLH
jgi:hypothetical protein